MSTTANDPRPNKPRVYVCVRLSANEIQPNHYITTHGKHANKHVKEWMEGKSC